MVRSRILAVGIALLLALPLALGSLPLALGSGSTAFADTYTGWLEIIPALTDGDKEGGAEFIVNMTYNVTFEGTELEQVLAANTWVHTHINYTYEPVDNWRSSDQIYADIEALGEAYDDCDGYAILLCALIRFNIGVPADRVWVACCAIHAVVQYETETGFKVTLDPTNNVYRRGGAPGQIKFNDEWAKYHGPPLFVFER